MLRRKEGLSTEQAWGCEGISVLPTVMQIALLPWNLVVSEGGSSPEEGGVL